jgi:hypothetical protein
MAEAANGNNCPASDRFSQTVAIFRLTGASAVSKLGNDGLDSLEQGKQMKRADSRMTFRRIGAVLARVPGARRP